LAHLVQQSSAAPATPDSGLALDPWELKDKDVVRLSSDSFCFPVSSQTTNDAEDNHSRFVCEDDICLDVPTSGAQVSTCFGREMQFEKIHGNSIWDESTRPEMSHLSKFKTFRLLAVGQNLGWYQRVIDKIRFGGKFGGCCKSELVPKGHNKGTRAEDLWLRRKHGFFDSSGVLQLILESNQSSSGSPYSGLKGE
jgi:hypothetical protein